MDFSMDCSNRLLADNNEAYITVVQTMSCLVNPASRKRKIVTSICK